MGTKIEWAEETWNPVTGCTKVSPGCKNCYAERMAKRLAGRYGYPGNGWYCHFCGDYYENGPGDCPECYAGLVFEHPFQVTLHPDRLEQPSRWKKSRMVFICSMGDLFHDAVPYDFIDEVFQNMYLADHQSNGHTWQILTKRARRLNHYMTSGCFGGVGAHEGWPTDNIWLGVTAENQKWADEQIPLLLQTPGPVRFVSVEPMLEPIDFNRTFVTSPNPWTGQTLTLDWLDCWGLDWVIIGCESGPGRRPMQLDWARDLIGQCKDAGVPVFVKQLDIDGRVSHNPAEWPEDLRIREFPNG